MMAEMRVEPTNQMQVEYMLKPSSVFGAFHIAKETLSFLIPFLISGT